MSTWKQVVVGTDDFAPRSRGPRTVLWLVVVLALVGAGVAVYALR